MATIVTRAAKGSPLTHAEVDANFTNLNSAKAEVSSLGTAAFTATTAYATAAQGALAETATQPADLATVATTGAYADLSGKPTLGTAAATASTDYATAAQGTLADSAIQSADLATVATTGAYSDLSGPPAAALPLTGGTLTGNVNLGDNVKAIFGAGSDLQIYHSGSHSVIKDAGDGNLQLIANDFQLRNGADNANMMTGANGGAVTLMHNGSSKLATSNTGITVTGTVAATAYTGDGSGLTGVGGVPSGVITMWSGAILAIPSGWFLCDGANGTPNLQDRFIVGAGSAYAVAATGGAASVTLTTAQMPAHTHTGPSHTHTGPSHTHTFSGTSSSAGAHSFAARNSGGGNDGANAGNGGQRYTLGGPNHTHTYSGTTAAGGTGATGASGTGATGSAGSTTSHENLPPYYALAYIMKS